MDQDLSFNRILCDWIEAYCDRHEYIILEIDWDRKCVFYYLEYQNVFEEYTDFNYLEVDLFS